MSSTTSYRLSGIALIVGSVLSIVYLLIQGMFLNGNDLATIIGSLSLISSVIGFVGSMLVLLGLPGMYVRQAGRAGILGLLGFLLIWYVTLYQGVIIPFTSVTIISQMTAHIVPQTVSVATTPPPAWAPFSIASMISEVLGVLLLAIATLRARVFPRWIGWLLIAILVVGVVSFVPFFPEALSNLAGVVASVATAGFGFALLSPDQHTAMEAVSTNAHVEARA